MKLIGPVAQPGVRHIVRLKDGSTAVAYMAFGHNDIADGTWLAGGKSVEAMEVVSPYRKGVDVVGLNLYSPPISGGE